MKKSKILGSILLVVIVVLIIGGLILCKLFLPPRVKSSERKNVTFFVENYLTEKYGEHNYKVTDIRYEYNMTTLFDYSSPTGYWVDFKSDVVPDSWITINGLSPDDYKVESEYFIESYYYPEQDGYNTYKILDNMKPKKELETNLLNELRNEIDSDVYEVKCESISLNIPEDYGKIPTLEELKTNTNLYEVTYFTYKVSNTIEDTNEHLEKLKAYITNKYNSNSSIYFHQENTLVSVFLED